VNGRTLDTCYVAVALLGVVGIALLFGVRRTEDYEEKTAYRPAIEVFAETFPRVPSAYPATVPPAALWFQGALWRVSEGSVTSARLLNLTLVLLAAGVLAGCGARVLAEGRRGEWLLSVLCHPTVATAAFLLKPNAWGLLWSSAGLALGLSARSRSSPARDMGTAASFSLGVLGHQIVTALAAHDVMEVALRSKGAWLHRLRRVVVRGLPLAAVMAFVLIWGGLTPPGWTDRGVERAVGGRFHAGQVLMGLIAIGAWVFPWAGFPRTALPLVIGVWPAACLGLHATGILEGTDSMGLRAFGPVRTLIARSTGGSYLLVLVVSGALAAVGVATLAGRWRESAPHRSFASLFVLYVSMMTLVPYHSEHYYMLLVVAGLILLADSPHAPLGSGFRCLRLLVALYGFAYAFLDASFRA
jgi:hypothetical protein